MRNMKVRKKNKSSPSLVGYATTAHLCVQRASRSCLVAQDSKKNKKSKADDKIGKAECPLRRQTMMAHENRKFWEGIIACTGMQRCFRSRKQSRFVVELGRSSWSRHSLSLGSKVVCRVVEL